MVNVQVFLKIFKTREAGSDDVIGEGLELAIQWSFGSL
jgi:hypothetical protein